MEGALHVLVVFHSTKKACMNMYAEFRAPNPGLGLLTEGWAALKSTMPLMAEFVMLVNHRV